MANQFDSPPVTPQGTVFQFHQQIFISHPTTETPSSVPVQLSPPLAQSSSIGASSSSSSTHCKIMKASGNAKQLLHEHYGKWKIQLPKESFIAWDNQDKSHIKKYSAIFVCPPYKRSLCRWWIDPCRPFLARLWETSRNGLVWEQEGCAMEAAAARALDCFRYRDSPRGERVRFQLGNDVPYQRGQTPASFPIIPPEVTAKVERLGGILCSR